MPPRLYLETETEESNSSPVPSDEESPTKIDDQYSIGSDSLYDMKLESVALPSRSTFTTTEPLQDTPLVENTLFHQHHKTCAPSSKENEHYQKLDIKQLNRPAAYEDVVTVRNERKLASSYRENTSKHPTTDNQYESLQPTTMETSRNYHDVKPQDSLYDMKLESAVLPPRSTFTTTEPLQDTPLVENTLFHQHQETCAPSSDTATGSKENEHYQKLDIKQLSRPAVYEDVITVRNERKLASGNQGNTSEQPTTGNQYESLHLTTMETPRNYQDVKPQETCQ